MEPVARFGSGRTLNHKGHKGIQEVFHTDQRQFSGGRMILSTAFY